MKQYDIIIAGAGASGAAATAQGGRYCAERIACRQVSPVITGGWCGRGARTRAERQGPGRDAAAAAVGAAVVRLTASYATKSSYVPFQLLPYASLWIRYQMV